MPQAPRDVPEVDPDTQGQENPISTSTDESIGITFQWSCNFAKDFGQYLGQNEDKSWIQNMIEDKNVIC